MLSVTATVLVDSLPLLLPFALVAAIQHFEQCPPVASDPKKPQPLLQRIAAGTAFDAAPSLLGLLLLLLEILYHLLPPESGRLRLHKVAD